MAQESTRGSKPDRNLEVGLGALVLALIVGGGVALALRKPPTSTSPSGSASTLSIVGVTVESSG